MNAVATFRDELWQPARRKIMSTPWIPLLFMGAASVVCYRLQNRRPPRWSTDSGSGVDFSSSSGWSFGDWFSSSSTDSSGNPTDSGGWDSSSGSDSSGGDSGGGGDGGGGGG
jgi:hypothetical protein